MSLHPPHEPEDRPVPGMPHEYADEHDPTGVRALLAGLPDPGPMPADLVARIEARLAVEREHLADAGADLGHHADHVVDLAAERSRRRPGRTLALLGAAAAGLVVTTVTLTQVLGDAGGADSGAVAQYPSRPAADDRSAGGGDVHADAEADAAADGAAEGEADQGAADEEAVDGGGFDAAQDTGDAAGPESGDLTTALADVVLLPDLGRVDEQDYGQVALAASGSGAEAAVESGLTSSQALSCWQGIAADQLSFETHYAAPATYLPAGGGTQDVVVLLGLDEQGQARAWVVPDDCLRSPDVAPLEPAGQPVTAP